MNRNVKQVLKIMTGIVIVPFGIMASKVWPWWQKQSLPIRVLSGIAILPFILLAAPISTWWDNF